ncbi:hypothetical protein L1887_51858 [Cichorium endivia]|nr:hypothetical protein L1887_51858 [Cichorium endivia]
MVERGEWGRKAKKRIARWSGAEAQGGGRLRWTPTSPTRRVEPATSVFSAPNSTALHCTQLHSSPRPARGETEVVGARRGESARRVGGQLIVPLPPPPPRPPLLCDQSHFRQLLGRISEFELDLLESAARLELLGPVDLTIVNLVIGTRSLQLTPLAKQHLLQLRMATFLPPPSASFRNHVGHNLCTEARDAVYTTNRGRQVRAPFAWALSTRTTSLKSLDEQG